MLAVGCVVALTRAAGGKTWMTTSVGSSSPTTSGSAWPLTLGSSLSACSDALDRIAWLATTDPSSRASASVMSNWMASSLFAGRLNPRTSSSPAPLVPPLGLVLPAFAPAGREPATSDSEPGTKTALVLSAPMSSPMEKLFNALLVVCTRSV